MQGYLQIMLKNVGGRIFHVNFLTLVDWIEQLHTIKETNYWIQKIVNKELTKTIHFGNLFYKIYNSIFFFTFVGITITMNLHNMIVINIPYVKAEDHSIIYQVIQGGAILLAGTWNAVSDCAIIFIGLYLLSFVKIINKMITSLTDQDVMIECPDLLLRTMKKHVEMIEVLGIFNDGVKLMSFIQILMSICFYLTSLLGIQTNKSELSLYMIFLSVLVQLFLLCLFGEIIKSETEVIFWNLYLTNWYEMSLTDQKILLIMMMNSQNEIGLKAAGMYDVSLMAFIQIVKVSISYSAIMLTLTGN
ncbi:Odorant receptor [Sergentomyia squamirostris]